MADFNDLGRTLTVLAARVGRNAQATQRKATKALAREVILRTPVDEGVARSNWQVGVSASGGVRPAYAPGRHLGIGETANAASAIAAANAAVDAAPVGTTLHVYNPVPYIGILNDGWSAQAPAGFVEAGVQAARREVRRNKIFRE